MANKILQRTPLVVVGDFLPEVKFNTELYIAEHDLRTPVTLTPITEVGTPESSKPIIGAKVIYKFTNTGPGGTITIGPGFSIDPQSVLFDPTPFAVNIVTMFYDGTDFWASLSTANPTPIPVPTGGGVSRIGDFGWGAGIIVVNTCPCEVGLIDLLGTPTAKVSAFDIISSVHYTGTDELVFILDDFYNQGSPESALDPKNAQWTYGCAELGTQILGIKIQELNGGIESDMVQAVIVVDDGNTLCP
jgi:hypothetical protein